MFTKLFSEPGALLELYNALSGGSYDVKTKIKVNTLEDVLFMDMMNDISFVIDDRVVVLIEHKESGTKVEMLGFRARFLAGQADFRRNNCFISRKSNEAWRKSRQKTGVWDLLHRLLDLMWVIIAVATASCPYKGYQKRHFPNPS